MNWKTIRLELSRTEGFPRGSASRSYLIRAPLDEHGSIDVAVVKRNPTLATVHRFWASEPDQDGYLEPVTDGWSFRARANGHTIGRLGVDPLRLDSQITITDPKGGRLPFRVRSIRDIGLSSQARR